MRKFYYLPRSYKLKKTLFILRDFNNNNNNNTTTQIKTINIFICFIFL